MPIGIDQRAVQPFLESTRQLTVRLQSLLGHPGQKALPLTEAEKPIIKTIAQEIGRLSLLVEEVNNRRRAIQQALDRASDQLTRDDREWQRLIAQPFAVAKSAIMEIVERLLI